VLIRELITKLGFQVDDAGMKKFESGIASMKAKAESLATSFKDIGQKMSVALTLPIAAAGTYALKKSGEFEQLGVAFETMIGDASKAAEFTNKLFDFAAETPFNVENLADASKKLLAFGVAADDVLPTLDSLGNIASGVGMDKLPNLITALGQVKSKTVLAGQELMQFTETGVPIIAELAKVTGHSIKDITNNTKDLGITYDQVLKALNNLSNGKFKDLMKKQSKTLLGQFSNFQDQLAREAARVGDILAPYAIKLLQFAQDVLVAFGKLSPETKKWIVIILGIVAALGPMLFILGQIGIAVTGLASAWGLLLPAIAIIGAIVSALGVLYLLYDDFAAYIEGRDNLLGPVWEKMLNVLNWMIDKWNSTVRFFQDLLLVLQKDFGLTFENIKNFIKTAFELSPLNDALQLLDKIWEYLGKINDYLGVSDKIVSFAKSVSGYNNFQDSVEQIQNRANEIDPNRSIRGGTPYYVNPFNIPGQVDKFAGPVNKKNDIRLNQAINIKVESGAKPEDIADAVKEGTRKLIGEQSSIISAAVEGGQLN